MADFAGAKRGDRLTAKNINEWILAGSRSQRKDIAGINAPKYGNNKKGILIPCVNLSEDTDIPAGAPVSLESLLDETEDGILNAQAFGVRLIEEAEASPIHGAIASNFIAYGEGGSVYVSGMCIAQVTDANQGLLAAAGITVIWDSAESGTRFALVRFGGGSAPDLWIKTIGGNPLASSLETIQYSATVTPAAVYDPEVDTVYPTGLGNGYLITDGVIGNKVLVRHSYAVDPSPLLSGRPVRVNGTEILSYGGTDMLCYVVHWI